MADHKPHILVIEARFYEDLADELAAGALEALEAGGATYERIAVPGAFEIPAAVTYALTQQELEDRHIYDGYVTLGCVIRGETTHYDYVCGESARGLMSLTTEFGLAIGYGILTVENEDQAWERAKRDRKNKGGVVAEACLAMIEHKNKFGLYPR